MHQSKALLSVVIGGLLCASAPALANELKLDLRADMVNRRFNDAAGKPDYTAFQMSRARLDMVGKLGELTSYRWRMDVLKSDQPASLRDKTSSLIDMAFLSRKMTDELSLQVGKIPTGVSAWEGSLSSADIYQTTTAWNESTSIFYSTGAALSYSKDGQSVAALVGNPGEDLKDTSGNLNQARNLWGLVYKGKFAEGMFSPIVTYHSEGRSNDRVYNYLGIGGKLTFTSFDVEFDYLSNSYKDKTTVGQTDKTDTMYALARYKWNEFMPHVKYEISSQKVESATPVKTDITGLTVALEYVPTKEEVFRYHAAYTDKTEKPDTAGASDKRTSTIFVGVRMVADLLK